MFTMLAVTLGGLVSRSVVNAITGISSRIMPFEGSGAARRMDYQANISREQRLASQEFQEYLQSKGLQNKKELTKLSVLLQRQTTFLSNIQNCQNTLKGKLFDDALRHFPLNIPPLVMLQNAGMSVNNITGSLIDDPITKYALSSWENGSMDENAFYLTLEDSIKSRPVALSVFVTPLQTDAHVVGKEKIASIVWDNVYREMESLFVKEYNRGSERPVIFYPGAWNLNAKPGLHASEILYFFTKGMPVIVLEPRFDGKRLRLMFSSWGVGMLGDNQVRQEISFNVDWNDLILPAMYDRSIKGLEKLNTIEKLPVPLEELKRRLAHNVAVYDLFKMKEFRCDDFLDDITKLFYLTNQDYSVISDMIGSTMGMVMSVVSDVHHLTASGIDPLFPTIKDVYFKDLFKSLSQNDMREMNDVFKDIFQTAYKCTYLTCNESTDSRKKSEEVKNVFKTEKETIFDILDNE